MPNEAARIWLKVTDVWVERLQEITEEQAEKEGAIDNRSFIHSPNNEYDNIHSAKEHFKQIWNSTIKKADLDRYGWDANPWVWVIEFERCEKPESEEKNTMIHGTGGQGMTEQEAIDILGEIQTDKPILEMFYGKCHEEALKMAISALEEIQQYRALGTVEELREAREKQVPKKPSFEGDGCDKEGNIIYDTWICPNCGKDYEVDYDEYEYCPNCGQAIYLSLAES